MAIDKSATTLDAGATLVGTTNTDDWTRVTCPAKARWAEVINDTGAAVQIQFGGPLQDEADTYAATDRQVTCADGARQVVPLSAGRATANLPAFNVRTLVATGTNLFRFIVGE